MRPNRLENVWEPLSQAVLSRWDRVKPSDLDQCKYQYDCIVEAIRTAYFRGRSHITLEAQFRDWLNETIAELEKKEVRNAKKH